MPRMDTIVRSLGIHARDKACENADGPFWFVPGLRVTEESRASARQVTDNRQGPALIVVRFASGMNAQAPDDGQPFEFEGKNVHTTSRATSGHTDPMFSLDEPP